MATEVDKLIVVYDANFKQLEDKLNKVIRSNYAAADKVAKSWRKADDGLDDFTQSLASFGAEIPVVGGALSKLGAVSLVAGAAVAALGVGFLGAMNAMKKGDELSTTAAKIGITAEALQELEYAAGESSVPIATLHTSLENLNGVLGAMKTGVGDAKVKEAFAFLRITPADLKGMNTAADLLPLIADRLQQVGTQAERVQLAKKLGLEGVLPMLDGGAAKLRAMATEARELGLVIDEDMVKSLAKANRQFSVAGEVIKAQLMPIFAEIAVTIGQVAQAIVNLIHWFRQLEKEHPRLAEWNRRLDPMQGSYRAGAWVREQLGFAPAAGPQSQAQRDAAAWRDWVAPGPTLTAPPKPPKVGKVGGGGRTQKPERITPVDIFDPQVFKWLEELAYWRKVQEGGLEPLKPFDGSGLTDVAAEAGEALQRTADETHAAVYDGIRGGLEAGFEDGLPGVLNYLQDALKKSVLDSVAEGLTSALLGSTGGKAGLLASLFKVPAHAAGALSTRSGMALVGEHGPELVSLPGGSQVLSNSALRNVGVRGGGQAGATIVFDNRGAVIWEQAARQMMSYADRAAGTAGAVAIQASRRVTPDDLARRGGRRLGR